MYPYAFGKFRHILRHSDSFLFIQMHLDLSWQLDFTITLIITYYFLKSNIFRCNKFCLLSTGQYSQVCRAHRVTPQAGANGCCTILNPV